MKKKYRERRKLRIFKDEPAMIYVENGKLTIRPLTREEYQSGTAEIKRRQLLHAKM